MSRKEEIIKQFQQVGLQSPALSELQFEQLSIYLELLQEWTKRIDLIAPASDEVVVEKHFLDSALAMNLVAGHAGEEICKSGLVDVGSGAGFPGMLAAVLGVFSHVTLIEPRQNRVGFLKEVRRKLKLENLDIFQGKLEEFAGSTEQHFGVMTSRALGRLELLREHAPELLVSGGFLAELQSREQEVDESCSTCLEYQLPTSNSARRVGVFLI